MIEFKKRHSAGEFLKTMILEERGLTQKWLAQKIGCAERKISEICNNKRRITASFALELEKVFGVSAEFWMSMQSKWDVFISRQKQKTTHPRPALHYRETLLQDIGVSTKSAKMAATRRMATKKRK